MPIFGGLAHERMPKESEFMASIIFCKMHPSIRKVLGNMTFMKCPCVSSYDETPLPQMSPNCRRNTCFFFQLSNRSQVGCLTWLDTAFDQLKAC
ncbi:hypothetical protein Q5O_03430 [Pseudomonas putida JB]|nr:hypothetical protein Q5O_03430 [Pseudomonas putida JB]